MNNLKFWSGKKTQNDKMFNVDTEYFLLPPPPNTCYRYCNCCHHLHNHQDDQSRHHLIIQPLPSWIDFEQTTHNTLLTREVISSGTWFSSMSEYSSTDQSESESDINATILPVSTNSSYQEYYKVENPVAGEPVLPPPPRRERSCDGIFGCGVKFGVHLIRCLCPCFHIHSVY